jgi:serine protease Do
MGGAACLVFALALGIPRPLHPLEESLQEDPSKPHVEVYRKVAPATVFVSGGRHEGSGVIIDKSGLILTSPTACGPDGESVTVIAQGHKQYVGRVVGRANEKEIVLVKIDAGELPAVELGDSDRVRVGQISYVLGDSFESIRVDGRPAISLGVVSGIYEIDKRQRGAYYTGKVIETSAAVNPNQDGGPLVDRHGRLLGIVTLNYDESKFTGIAIPVNELRNDIERLRAEAARGTPVAQAAEPAPKGPSGWLGADVEAVRGGLQVTVVKRNGPADKAGIRKGDVLTQLGDAKTPTQAALAKALAARSPGDLVKATLLRDSATLELTVTLGKKVLY